MKPGVSPKAFLCYSRKDANFVTNLFRLLRSVGSVFLDTYSLNPGDVWRTEVDEAINGCSVFILCWCGHAKRSREVKKEYRLALRLQKRIIPLILEDLQPLPPELEKFQRIDFSNEVKHLVPGGVLSFLPHEQLHVFLTDDRVDIREHLKKLRVKLRRLSVVGSADKEGST